MPYVLWKENNKKVSHPFVYTKEEAERIVENSPGKTFVFINTTTRRQVKLKGPKK